jgi:hypothetical protein
MSEEVSDRAVTTGHLGQGEAVVGERAALDVRSDARDLGV